MVVRTAGVLVGWFTAAFTLAGIAGVVFGGTSQDLGFLALGGAGGLWGGWALATYHHDED